MSGRPAEPDPRLIRARERMVADQLRARGIADERVLDVMGRIPRERFIGESERRHAYDDEALPIEAGQTISQPYMVARMTELLAPRPGDRILEIGTGSGYQAAILAALGGRVTTIERHEDLAATARGRGWWTWASATRSTSGSVTAAWACPMRGRGTGSS